MGINFTPSSSSGKAIPLPFAAVDGKNFEGYNAKGEGVYDAKFTAVNAKAVKSEFQSIEKDDNNKDIPNSYEWAFNLCDEDRKVIYLEDGDPFEVTRLTSLSTNAKAKTTPGAVKVLKALMTSDEWDEFEKQSEMGAEDPAGLAAYLEKYPDRVIKDSDLAGRYVQLDISLKENGWPKIDEVRRVKQPRSATGAEKAVAKD